MFWGSGAEAAVNQRQTLLVDWRDANTGTKASEAAVNQHQTLLEVWVGDGSFFRTPQCVRI